MRPYLMSRLDEREGKNINNSFSNNGYDCVRIRTRSCG